MTAAGRTRELVHSAAAAAESKCAVALLSVDNVV